MRNEKVGPLKVVFLLFHFLFFIKPHSFFLNKSYESKKLVQAI
jgi:hypothetical protein